jgi:hypothetical protein
MWKILISDICIRLNMYAHFITFTQITNLAAVCIIKPVGSHADHRPRVGHPRSKISIAFIVPFNPLFIAREYFCLHNSRVNRKTKFRFLKSVVSNWYIAKLLTPQTSCIYSKLWRKDHVQSNLTVTIYGVLLFRYHISHYITLLTAHLLLVTVLLHVPLLCLLHDNV